MALIFFMNYCSRFSHALQYRATLSDGDCLGTSGVVKADKKNASSKVQCCDEKSKIK